LLLKRQQNSQLSLLTSGEMELNSGVPNSDSSDDIKVFFSEGFNSFNSDTQDSPVENSPIRKFRSAVKRNDSCKVSVVSFFSFFNDLSLTSIRNELISDSGCNLRVWSSELIFCSRLQ